MDGPFQRRLRYCRYLICLLLLSSEVATAWLQLDFLHPAHASLVAWPAVVHLLSRYSWQFSHSLEALVLPVAFSFFVIDQENLLALVAILVVCNCALWGPLSWPTVAAGCGLFWSLQRTDLVWNLDWAVALAGFSMFIICVLVHWRARRLLQAQAALKAKTVSLGRFLPSDVSVEERSGERCFITVAFVDMVGFTQAMAVHGDQAVSERLHDFFGEVHRAVAVEGGVVHKFMGDGALCVFNESLAGEGARACVESMTVIRATHNVRVGIASGWCLMGAWGSDKRQDFTVLGVAVNLASRLQSMAEPREILIDEHTARFLTPHFETQKQLVDVKGMGPQIAYAVC